MCKSRLALCIGSVAILLPAQPVRASFHLMQITKVIGSTYGDTSVQAIELCMRADGQGSLSAARIRAFDATGQNPVIIIDFTTNVSNDAAGQRVLIVSPNFAAHTFPPAVGDFTMSNLIPASYLAAGSLTYESDGGGVLWRLSWGGSAYTGPHTGAAANDDDGNFGPAYPNPLCRLGVGALRFGCSQAPCHANLSTTNAADYGLAQDIIFINNAGNSFNFNFPIEAGDTNCDHAVDLQDVDAFVLAILDASGYFSAHSCCTLYSADLNNDGSRDGEDVIAFVDLLVDP